MVAFGLGDWCQTKYHGIENIKSPLEFTDTVISIDIARKSAFIFKQLGNRNEEIYANNLADKLLSSARAKLLDLNTMTAIGNCQTSQAMAIFYNIFEKAEQPKAFEVLLKYIDEETGHIDVGVLGARILFHVLTQFGRSDIAYNMITRKDFPSYGHWLVEGATSLFEDFLPENAQKNSLNHHFFGDISNWFMQAILGIRYNPNCDNIYNVDIIPSFIPQLSYAEGFYNAPCGKIKVKWQRTQKGICLDISVPDKITGNIICPNGWIFNNHKNAHTLSSNRYLLTQN